MDQAMTVVFDFFGLFFSSMEQKLLCLKPNCYFMVSVNPRPISIVEMLFGSGAENERTTKAPTTTTKAPTTTTETPTTTPEPITPATESTTTVMSTTLLPTTEAPTTLEPSTVPTTQPSLPGQFSCEDCVIIYSGSSDTSGKGSSSVSKPLGTSNSMNDSSGNGGNGQEQLGSITTSTNVASEPSLGKTQTVKSCSINLILPEGLCIIPCSLLEQLYALTTAPTPTETQVVTPAATESSYITTTPAPVLTTYAPPTESQTTTEEPAVDDSGSTLPPTTETPPTTSSATEAPTTTPSELSSSTTDSPETTTEAPATTFKPATTNKTTTKKVAATTTRSSKKDSTEKSKSFKWK